MRLIVAAALVLMSPLAYAQPKPPAPSPPGSKVEHRDIAYVPNGDKAQVLDIYVPEKASAKPLPLIVWVHGGGWKGGSKNGGPFAAFLNEGYAVASVEYRFSQARCSRRRSRTARPPCGRLCATRRSTTSTRTSSARGARRPAGTCLLPATQGGKKTFPAIGGNEGVSDRVQVVCDFYGPADFTTVVEQAGQLDKSIKFMYAFEVA